MQSIVELCLGEGISQVDSQSYILYMALHVFTLNIFTTTVLKYSTVTSI